MNLHLLFDCGCSDEEDTRIVREITACVDDPDVTARYVHRLRVIHNAFTSTPPTRRAARKERKRIVWEEHLALVAADGSFRRMYRMTPAAFHRLHSILQVDLERNTRMGGTDVRKHLSKASMNDGIMQGVHISVATIFSCLSIVLAVLRYEIHGM